MSRVITFSRFFPATHPKKGQPTYFVEQIWNSVFVDANYYSLCEMNKHADESTLTGLWDFWKSIKKSEDTPGIKGHTIRAGNRWKIGDKFSPRVWSGKPYQTKQITIAPDIEIKKIWTFEIKDYEICVGGCLYNGAESRVALNDGLTQKDFLDWFNWPKPFTGQIICWNDQIEY